MDKSLELVLLSTTAPIDGIKGVNQWSELR